MSSRSRPPLLVLATLCLGLAPAVTLVAPTAAVATKAAEVRPSVRVVHDPELDVQQPAEQNSDDYVPAPDRALGDITRFRVRHGAHRVSVQIRAQELVRPKGDDYQVVLAGVQIRTARDSFYAWLVLDNYSPRATVLFGRRGEEPTACRGLGHDFDAQRDVATVSIPRRCLGGPRWVKAAGALAYSWPGGGDGDFYVDLTPDADVLGRKPVYTRRAWYPLA